MYWFLVFIGCVIAFILGFHFNATCIVCNKMKLILNEKCRLHIKDMKTGKNLRGQVCRSCMKKYNLESADDILDVIKAGGLK